MNQTHFTLMERDTFWIYHLYICGAGGRRTRMTDDRGKELPRLGRVVVSFNDRSDRGSCEFTLNGKTHHARVVEHDVGVET